MYLCIPMKEISENKQHTDEAAPAKHREHYGNNGNGSFNIAKRSKTEQIIMGIDPGTNLLGYGVLKVCGKKAEMVAMGVIDLRKVKDVYLKLGRIHERVNSLIASFLPDELSIESQFYGNNPQSMLKLGRAQGVAIAAAINRDVPIHCFPILTQPMLSPLHTVISLNHTVKCMKLQERIIPHLMFPVTFQTSRENATLQNGQTS